jgi:hypothetical protein
MPILGSLASQNTKSFLFAPSGAYDSIASTTVGSGGTGTITFSSIPATYTDLQVRITAQSNRATYSLDDIRLKFNADVTSHGVHTLYGEGSAAEGNYITNNIGERALGTGVFGNFGAYIIDILDYKNTSKYKTYRALAGTDSNGIVAGYAPMINLVSGLWQNTSAITDLTFTPVNGTLFNQYSSFALYGIKG